MSGGRVLTHDAVERGGFAARLAAYWGRSPIATSDLFAPAPRSAGEVGDRDVRAGQQRAQPEVPDTQPRRRNSTTIQPTASPLASRTVGGGDAVAVAAVIGCGRGARRRLRDRRETATSARRRSPPLRRASTVGCSRASRNARPSSVAEAKRCAGILLQQRRDDRRQRRTDPVAAGSSIGAGSETCLRATATGVSPMNGRRPGHHLVEDDAQRIQIGARVELVTLRLFRRNVRNAAHHHPGLGHADDVLGDGARDAEVAELHDVVAR